ncbi:hypothetical protein NC651_025811 [Populus alba x Populus x berolinensis]|nr:hypothetical protein NC651_025811 [Populus alba x Populus x berolinensis]
MATIIPYAVEGIINQEEAYYDTVILNTRFSNPFVALWQSNNSNHFNTSTKPGAAASCSGEIL